VLNTVILFELNLKVVLPDWLSTGLDYRSVTICMYIPLELNFAVDDYTHLELDTWYTDHELWKKFMNWFYSVNHYL
jgi:hypothetical protein